MALTVFPYRSGSPEGIGPLKEGEVRLWCVNFKSLVDTLPRLAAVLSSDETERASRFRLKDHRDQYITTRGLLRYLLAHFLGMHPAHLTFHYGAHGKPEVVDAHLTFNLSHSGDLALYAFTLTGPIGVDVEQHRELTDLENIARRFFAKREVDDLLSLDPEQRCPAFFRCWTRKESFVKAVGDGLYIPLDSFRVTLLPDEQPAILEGPPEKIAHWKLTDVTPEDGYAGALMTAGAPLAVNAFRASAPSELLRISEQYTTG